MSFEKMMRGKTPDQMAAQGSKMRQDGEFLRSFHEKHGGVVQAALGRDGKENMAKDVTNILANKYLQDGRKEIEGNLSVAEISEALLTHEARIERRQAA
jgi:hypothetical protein